uniref:Uncharacterized protein n=1 Tax=Brassica oleracea TaxID=3712 RepID=A0A3P6ESD9_BRAOL|nr:unnamed protein product [Brassica oleracea]
MKEDEHPVRPGEKKIARFILKLVDVTSENFVVSIIQSFSGRKM